MEIRKIIRRILMEEPELPSYLRRRINQYELDNLVDHVEYKIDHGSLGYSDNQLKRAIEDSIFYFIEQNSLLQELLNGITSEDEYLETYSKIEIPLTNYIKKMIK